MHLTLKNRQLKIVSIHFTIWVIYIAYELITIFQVGGLEMNLLEAFLNFILYAALFYTNSFYVLPRFYKKRKYYLLIPVLIILFVVFIFLRYQLKVFVLPLFIDELIYPYESSRLFLAETLWRGGYFIMISFGYWFASNLLKIEKEKSQDLKKIAMMEKGIQEAEIRNLKNQINPHFLFNTLNFLFDRVNAISESTGKAILLLSDVMRYSLKKPEVGSKVFLEDEVQYLKNYIEINQLRFDNALQLQFTVTGNLQYRLVIPLLLITFVENCFKYGELFDKEHPVKIDLEVTDSHLAFKTHNKKKLKPDLFGGSTGIGHKNAIKRLAMIYGDQYKLDIKEEEGFHAVKLFINL